MRIMLVEDNSDHRELMRFALTRYDSTWEVEAVASGEEALRLLLGGEVFDLVFLDYSLPRRDGLEVLEEIRRGEAPPPVVVVTGRGDEQVAVKAMKGGAYDYLAKGEGYLQRLPMVAQRAVEAHQLSVKHKHAEEALRESEERLRTVVEASLDAIIAVNAEGRLVLFNGAAQELFHYSEEEALNQPAEILLREEIGKIHQERLEKFLKRGVGRCGHIGRRMEKLFRRKDGSLFEAEVSMSGGRLNGLRLVVLAIHDITSHKQDEEVLRQSEEKYRDIFDKTVEGIYRTTPAGHFFFLNPAFARICGYASPGEMMEKVTDIGNQLYANPEDRLKFQKRIAAEGEVKGLEVQFKHPTKGLVWISINSKALRDEQGNIQYYDGTIEDITERKQAEEELRRSEDNFRHSLDDSPMGVRIVTVEGETIYANRAILNIYGYDSVEDLKITPVEKRYTPESHTEFQIRREKRKRGDYDPSEYEISIVRKDGKIRHLQVFRNETLWDGERQFQVLYNDITERKKAEDALKESEEKYRSLFENANESIFVAQDGKLVFVNPMTVMMIGYSGEELISRPFIEFIHPDDREMVIDRHVRRMKGEEVSHHYVFRIIHKNGSVKWVELNAVLINWTGRPATLNFLSDITDRKQAEEKIATSEEKYRELANLLPQIVYETDEHANFTFVNQASRSLTGYIQEDFKDLNALQMVAPIDRDRVKKNILKLMQGEMITGNEYLMQRKDGSTFSAIFHSIPIIKENKIVGFRGFAVDISERKQMEKHLKESEETMRYIIKHDPNAIAVYDRNLHYIAVSNRYLQDYNIKESDVIGKHHYEVFPEMPQRWKDVHARCLAGAIERNDDDYFERTDGSITYNRWECRPWHQSDGEIGGIITYTEVTTERKKAEEELMTSRLQLRALARRQQRIREEERIMIAREIHDDMGGGLTGLKMDLSWLLRKMGDADMGETRNALMDKIHASNELIDQMIHVVRRISTDLRPSILDDLGLIAALEWQLSEFTSRTEIPHEFATTFEYVNMEEDTAVAVFRIFQETLTNVVRHSRATKVVVVFREGERSLFGDETFVLEIRDNGRGITEEEIWNSESLGLLGMKERVLTFRGELSIHGEPDRGTSVILKIPQDNKTSLHA